MWLTDSKQLNDLKGFEDSFIGRESELNLLLNNFKTETSPYIIIGRRGVGKTALLRMFSIKAAPDYPGGIVTNSARNKLNLVESINNFIGSPPVEQTLFVIDDLEYLSKSEVEKLIKPLFKIDNLKLVITTRQVPEGLDRPYKVVQLEAPNPIEIIKKRIELVRNKELRANLFTEVNDYVSGHDLKGKSLRDAILEFFKYVKKQGQNNEIVAADVRTVSSRDNEEILEIKPYIFGILVPLILFIWSQIASYTSEVSILEELKRHDTKIEKLISEISDNNELEIYFVNRNVNFREAPTTKEPNVITILSQNTLVMLVKTNGKWKQVKYCDYSNNQEIIGWVYQTYLTKLDMNTENHLTSN